MKIFAFAAFLLAALTATAAGEAPPFSQTLDAAARQRLGLATLTPAQFAELDAAVTAYTRGEKTVAVQQAVAQVEQQAAVKVQQAEQKAAVTAVADYKKQLEPGVIARTLEVFKRQQNEEKRPRFTAHVVGEFRGWSGGTYFPLSDGQVWRQVGTEEYELPPAQDAVVEIFQSSNGYWRLKYADAWITVTKAQ